MSATHEFVYVAGPMTSPSNVPTPGLRRILDEILDEPRPGQRKPVGWKCYLCRVFVPKGTLHACQR